MSENIDYTTAGESEISEFLAEPETETETPETETTTESDDDVDLAKWEDSEEEAQPEPEPVKKSKTKTEETPDVNKHGEPITHDPLKDTQAALTRANQEKLEYRRRYLETLEKTHGNALDELNEEERALLREEDPEAYIEYLESRAEAMPAREEITRLRAEDEQETEQQRYYAQQTTASERLIAFGQSVGAVGKDLTTPEAREKAAKFLSGEKMTRALEVLNNPAYRFSPDDTGVYTVEQLRIAFQIANADTEKTKNKADGFNRAVESISNARNGGSRLDRAPASTERRSVPKYSQKELASLGETELNAILAEEDEKD